MQQFEVLTASIDETIPVGRACALFPVGVAGDHGSFALHTTDDRQYCAYFDGERRLRVASRSLDSRHWDMVVLPETLGWDSHNYLELHVDRSGHVHLAGNMHVSPLCYYRSASPGDITTLEPVSVMTGSDEAEVTYPRFLRDPDGALLFTYRDGQSGAGRQFFNQYDEKTQTWRRLFDEPLIDGEGQRNAYLFGPLWGPDGRFHLSWVWRDTADAESTHSLCYAKSPDLKRWETGSGEPLTLPITFDAPAAVDPVGPNGGLINNNHPIGFDAAGRVVISYQKHDIFGNTQIHQARYEDAGWRLYRTTDWAHRWDFGGPGSLEFELRFGPVFVDGAGLLLQRFRHAVFGEGTLVLDEGTLRPLGIAKGIAEIPPGILTTNGRDKDFVVNLAMGTGEGADAGRYLLRWESLPEYRDLARTAPWPEPSELTLFRVAPGRIVRRDDETEQSFYWRSHAAAREKSHPGKSALFFDADRQWLRRLREVLGHWLPGKDSKHPHAPGNGDGNNVDELHRMLAEAHAAAKMGDYAKAARLSQQVSIRLPDDGGLAVSDARLFLSAVRRLARLDEWRREVDEFRATCTGGRERPRIAVYTANCGGYEAPKVPQWLDPRYDYHLFCDRPETGGEVWQVRPVTGCFADPTRSARWIKLHPHFLFPDYDIALWVDSNIMILGNLFPLLREFSRSGKAVGAFHHPYRKNIYQEAKACIALDRDDPQLIRRQVRRHKQEGFSHQDLLESNVIAFNLRHPGCRPFLDAWWREIDRGSRRDQLSVNYALRKSRQDWHAFGDRPRNARNEPRLAFGLHDGGEGVAAQLANSLGHPRVDPYAGPSYASVKARRLEALEARSVDVVVCVHNAPDCVAACVESIIRTRKAKVPQRLILVDDGSDTVTADYLRSVAGQHEWITLLRNEAAVGYTRAANLGAAASGADLVIFLNSDTIVTDDWAEKLTDAAFSTPGTGIVGPMSNAASHQSIPDHRNSGDQTAINRLPPGRSVDDMNRLCEEWTVDGVLPSVPLVHGFCFGVARAVIDRIGLFDDGNFPYGYGEENDYCFRATDAGFRLAIATHTFVYHEKSQSYANARRVALTREGSNAFVRLYGRERVERAVEAMQRHPQLERLRARAWSLCSDQPPVEGEHLKAMNASKTGFGET